MTTHLVRPVRSFLRCGRIRRPEKRRLETPKNPHSWSARGGQDSSTAPRDTSCPQRRVGREQPDSLLHPFLHQQRATTSVTRSNLRPRRPHTSPSSLQLPKSFTRAADGHPRKEKRPTKEQRDGKEVTFRTLRGACVAQQQTTAGQDCVAGVARCGAAGVAPHR